MLEQIIPLAMQIILIIVSSLAAVFSAFAVAWLKEKYGLENLKRVQQEIENKQELALQAVRFAEQAYKDLNGPGKFIEASEYLSLRLEEKGMAVSEDEIRGLIEASVRILKDTFGSEWARQVN